MYMHAVLELHILYFVYMQIPGVLIFRFIAPFCYTNTQMFVTKLSAACDIDPEKGKNMSLTNNQPGCIEVAFYKVSHV